MDDPRREDEVRRRVAVVGGDGEAVVGEIEGVMVVVVGGAREVW